MDNIKSRKKSIKFRKNTAFITIGIIILAVLLFLFLRPSSWFLFKQNLARNFTKVEVKSASITDEKFSNMTFAEIESDKRFTIDKTMMLINKNNRLSEDFKANTGEYKSSEVFMDKSIMGAYEQLASDVLDKFNNNLYIMSAFRDKREQADISAEQEAKGTAMPEGASEHQAGLAIDVYVFEHAGLGFLNSDEGRYVNSNCWENGFIIRYPKGKEKVTQVEFEPWHLRYVGFPHAEIMSKNSLTLEEYYDSMEVGKFYSYSDYVITKQNGEGYKVPENFISAVFSPDNMGGVLITFKVKE